jgi:hypothetical protein
MSGNAGQLGHVACPVRLPMSRTTSKNRELPTFNSKLRHRLSHLWGDRLQALSYLAGN